MKTSVVPASLADLTGSWSLDPAHSRLGFMARHAMVTRVRGSFNEFEGTVTVDDGDVSSSRIEITIRAGSIDTRNTDRDAHLRSGDFLEVDRYPSLTFSSTSAAVQGSTLEVTGDLTIKGVTRSLTIPFLFGGAVLDPYGNVRAGFEGSVTISRADFGVTWNAVLETGGMLVSDKVTLELDVSAVRA